MQNIHFFSFVVLMFGGGGGGQSAWTKSQALLKFFSEGSPKSIILILSEKVIIRGPLVTERGSKGV